ncbi:hypothetical protein [Hymenobacter chitinivorans]|uniref:Uncharacterized protein n=1 Tax=Hymenobacter chitinivorans DSM 11115 TaxID=1121954 RepID=A0A2M9BA26_9BACT|nr:hypothetical protein [Hymenobacter chitinivorans]PJJ54798.1 hypothetical protein CLV45_3144 [Hymenobacter chitinivorans DSM 11115]
MDTNNEHSNAESRRQERREHDKEQYRKEGIEMGQEGPDPNLPHHARSRTGDGKFMPDSQAETGSTDGIAKTIAGSGANNGGRYHSLDEVNNSSPNADQGGTPGAGQSREPQLRTPSAQTSHTSKGPQSEGGESQSQGSKSGNQS